MGHIQRRTSAAAASYTSLPALLQPLLTMLFFPIVASFFAFGALTAVASPAPVVDTVEKRQDVSSVLAILDTLQSQTGSILPQIDSLVNSNAATEENLTPLAQQLVAALNSGGASLESLRGRVNQDAASNDEAAEKAAAIYTVRVALIICTERLLIEPLLHRHF